IGSGTEVEQHGVAGFGIGYGDVAGPDPEHTGLAVRLPERAANVTRGLAIGRRHFDVDVALEIDRVRHAAAGFGDEAVEPFGMQPRLVVLDRKQRQPETQRALRAHELRFDVDVLVGRGDQLEPPAGGHDLARLQRRNQHALAERLRALDLNVVNLFGLELFEAAGREVIPTAESAPHGAPEIVDARIALL